MFSIALIAMVSAFICLSSVHASVFISDNSLIASGLVIFIAPSFNPVFKVHLSFDVF